MTQELVDLAVEVAQDAGALLLGFQRDRLTVDTKTSATDPVSEADRSSERLIVERLLDARPGDGILGEEAAGDRRGTSGIGWVIDPLDGTVNYLYGIPLWCVSVAAEDDRGPLVGVVHDPNRGETFVARRGHGATLDGRHRLEVTAVGSLDRTLVATGFAYDPAVRADQGVMMGSLLTHVRDLRRGGAAALDLAWTAAGRIDAYLEFGLATWDWAAGALLVREAGGVTTWHERELGGRRLRGLLAGGSAAHEALRSWLERR